LTKASYRSTSKISKRDKLKLLKTKGSEMRVGKLRGPKTTESKAATKTHPEEEEVDIMVPHQSLAGALVRVNDRLFYK
jgi:hypothetical protein